MDRRTFLRISGGTAAAVAASSSFDDATSASGQVRFAHGVASGDPLPDGVVLWTRVTPAPGAHPGSGLGGASSVHWEVAADRRFRRVIKTGTLRTSAAVDHTVKVDVRGLRPNTYYWYRFGAGGASSPVGRTKTAPKPTRLLPELRLGLVSCSNWEAGWFNAYRHLADRNDCDLVVHVGDYLYEYEAGGYPADGTVRRHQPRHEIVSLADYRRRHGQYKTDGDLQRLHANYPWVVTWDDHESANDAWRGGAENHDPGEGSWRDRRRAAKRAYYEWMPIRGDGGPLQRRLSFGRLADLTMLDLRSYRDRQAEAPIDETIADPDRTLTGADQMAWLRRRLSRSQATWKLVGNSVMIAPVVFPPLPEAVGRPIADLIGLYPDDGVPYNVDQWDGYQADRDRVTDHLHRRSIDGAVFLTGDIHSSWAADVPVDAGTYTGTPSPTSPSAGIEIVCPSVTSDNLDEITGSPPRTTSLTVEQAIRAANRHIELVEFDSHGYTVVDLTPDRLQADWWYTTDRTDSSASERYGYSFRSVAGSNTVAPARRALRPRTVPNPPLVG